MALLLQLILARREVWYAAAADASSQPHPQGTGERGGAGAAGGWRALGKQLVVRLLGRLAFWGLGVTADGGRRAGAHGSSSPLLPPCDHLRLVGIKVPAGPCWVRLGVAGETRPSS